MHRALTVLALPLIASCAAPAADVRTAASPVACEALTGLSLPHLSVVSARLFPASPASESAPTLPASCRIIGIARPTTDSEIRFEVAIPSGGAWNGRYKQVGNGGFAGKIPEDEILDGLAEGYATAGTDDGHDSENPTDASWALGHPEKVVDFGYRALKETTDAARAILRAHTGRAPVRSYFEGCSDGGREALMEAQRYPDDFDGIVAGAPANHWTRLLAAAAWNAQALQETPASYVPPGKLRAIEDAALAACGDADRVVEDPPSCRFDPAVLRCAGADSDACLTDAQIKAVRAIYAGPRNPRTSELIFPGQEPGSEAERGGWQTWVSGRAPGKEGGAALTLFASSFYAYIVFGDPSYDLRRLDFDGDMVTTEARVGKILNAEDPDLTAFRRHGGKLIQWHGWGDPAIPARDSIAYYEAVRTKLGGVDDFYRLFMAPGTLHCGGGAGPDHFTRLPSLVAWVEEGKAPERIVAARMTGEPGHETIVRTRPLCPYPRRATWDGKGDRARAESYLCTPPAVSPK
jgi:feruloyl esterase